jgi:hypothetical protein
MSWRARSAATSGFPCRECGRRALARRANVCFGGLKKNRLYICGTTSLYAVLTHVNGEQRP